MKMSEKETALEIFQDIESDIISDVVDMISEKVTEFEDELERYINQALSVYTDRIMNGVKLSINRVRLASKEFNQAMDNLFEFMDV